MKCFTVRDTRQFEVTFAEAVPAAMAVGDALENLTWTPDLQVQACRFEDSRAWGPLVSTPGRVIIEDSIFEKAAAPPS